ncbi:unnamed protein product [Lactuca virosa]|uniref:Secreted protein n=1 Tax=Lactuca virosa TaxID=75947 RepID=A0AAU9N219_9ASTR|nr:unnamed protein product [Lactuca virosa]
MVLTATRTSNVALVICSLLSIKDEDGFWENCIFEACQSLQSCEYLVKICNLREWSFTTGVCLPPSCFCGI